MPILKRASLLQRLYYYVRLLATLALGSSNSDQLLSKVATLAPKLAKPLGMAPPPLFLDLVSPIQIDHHFVLFILVFCVNKVTQKLDFDVSTSLSSYHLQPKKFYNVGCRRQSGWSRVLGCHNMNKHFVNIRWQSYKTFWVGNLQIFVLN